MDGDWRPVSVIVDDGCGLHVVRYCAASDSQRRRIVANLLTLLLRQQGCAHLIHECESAVFNPAMPVLAAGRLLRSWRTFWGRCPECGSRRKP